MTDNDDDNVCATPRNDVIDGDNDDADEKLEDAAEENEEGCVIS